MNARDNSHEQVSAEFMTNRNSVKERPQPIRDIVQHKEHPRVLVQNHGDRSPETPPFTMSRLLPVEGLRAYLALWVLAGHALWVSGYEGAALTGLPKLIERGGAAVDLFIIISGFAITFSLDTRRQTYLQFIAQRFFRLFPVFIALFVVAIPLSQVSLWNVTHASQYLRPDQIMKFSGMLEAWWANIHWNLPLHLLMLHGTVPEALDPHAPEAFLVPAWSVSLEWQFYLVAPLAYAWAVSARPYRRIALCGLCLALVWAARYVLPWVHFGAALPFHIEYFFLGAVSYFIYQRWAAHQLPDITFPVACCLALFLYWRSGGEWSLIPVGLWLVFLGLILEHPSSFSSRLVSPLLTNPFVLYLGRISYSIYLSHILVIIVFQYALLTWAPHLTRMVHFGVLLASSTAATIALSAGLYRYLETPGIQAGRSLSSRLAARRGVGA